MKKEIKPPALADCLFKKYCKNAQIEDLHGDVEELFHKNLKTMSTRKAKLHYWIQIISLVFSYAMKRRKQNASNHPFASSSFNPGMIKNYFLIASRSLVKHKFFTVINVVGLAVGMSICLLLIAFFSFISTYDEFHVNKDSIYRVLSITDDKTETKAWSSAPLFLAQLLKDGYSGIDEVVRISAMLGTEVELENRKLPLSGFYVDPNFLQVFTFPLLKGHKERALVRANTLVLTARGSKKLFGDADPMGRIIKLAGSDFEVTGVLENHPKNSHMQFEALASYESLGGRDGSGAELSYKENVREFRNQYVYLQLPPTTDISQLQRYLNEDVARVNDSNDFSISFELQRLTSIATGRSLSNAIGPEWDLASLSGFIVIALLILIPASFNYGNISIAQALKRMKEIGLRKMMGGLQRQIFMQFIIETIIICFVALGLSFYIFTIIRQEFLSMLVSGDAISLELDLPVVLYFILFATVVGVATGFVPAYYFSRLNPIAAMKKTPGKSNSTFSFRKSLTVFQFALSIGFITSVVVIMSQYKKTINYDFGFQRENILDVQLQDIDPNLFRNEFSKLAGVAEISMSSHIMGIEGTAPEHLKYADGSDSLEVFQMFIDDHYLSNLNLELLAGRNFARNDVSEKNIIVNETFLEKNNIENPASLLGKTFMLHDREVELIGVVKNFHYAQLDEPIESFMFRYDERQWRVANLKIASTDIRGTFTDMEELWKPLAGEKKFTAHFFEEEIEDAYSHYFVLLKICGFLGFLAITISCLGLLGMVVLTVESKMKEIGIRKVMGASVSGMIMMLSKDFMKLIVIASCIALPLTYLFFDKVYLRSQHYKIPISAAEILLSVAIILSFGLATILSQTVRAAQANPVDTLRND
ncbi:MAG: ABC transporter permease [Cyclobacteriaceae bacterium]